MPARRRDFIIEPGATFQRQVNLEPGLGAEVDLSAYTARMKIRPDASSSTVILDVGSYITAGFGCVYIDVDDDITAAIDTSSCTRTGTINEPATVSCDLPYSATGPLAVYDLEIESPAGVVTRLLSGNVVFPVNVTR